MAAILPIKMELKLDIRNAVRKVNKIHKELKKVKRLTLWTAFKLRIAGIYKKEK